MINKRSIWLSATETEEQLLKGKSRNMKLGLILGGVLFVGGLAAVIYSLQFI